MVKAGQLEKNMFILMKDEPYLIAEREFVNPGKGSAFVRLKLKNLYTGQVLKPTLKTQEQVEEINVEEAPCQFLYADSDSYHFMDNDTFEQFEIAVASFEDKKYFMKEGDTYKVVRWGTKPIDIVLPYKMVFDVIEAENAVKGDTVNAAMKTVIIETGLEIKAPIFIKTGEKIMINTETKEYVERVNS